MHNNIIGTAKYDWSCTDGDEGCRYIPSITRDIDDVLHVPTNGDELHIYHLSELDESCYGRVIAIKYCYQFNDTTVPASFNWTILLLEEIDCSEDFKIRDIITIENCESDAISSRPDQSLCCDIMIDIESFDVYISQGFLFGVTESSQGNTAGATLLGFADAQPQYQVDVVLINRAEVTSQLSVGSNIAIRNRKTTKRAIRMLWFVIGKLNFTILATYTYNDHNIKLIYPLLADDNIDEESATSERSSDSTKFSRSALQETACAPTQDTESMVFSDQTSTQLINEDENHSAMVISASIGGAIGGILGLSLVSVIIVLLVIVRRHQLEKAPGHIENDVKGYHNAVYNGMLIVKYHAYSHLFLHISG